MTSRQTQLCWNGYSNASPLHVQTSFPCALCGGTVIQPTYLTCKHIFCYHCLRQYVERGKYINSIDFPCPYCQKRSAPPWGNWHLSHEMMDRSHDELYETWKYEAICDNCGLDGLYATAGRRCIQCGINMCDTCCFTHSVIPDTSRHKIIALRTRDGSAEKDSENNQLPRKSFS